MEGHCGYERRLETASDWVCLCVISVVNVPLWFAQEREVNLFSPFVELHFCHRIYVSHPQFVSIHVINVESIGFL